MRILIPLILALFSLNACAAAPMPPIDQNSAIYRVPVEPGVTYDDVVTSLKVISEGMNFVNPANFPIGDHIKQRGQNNAQTSGTFDARSCVAPTYYTSYGGYLEFNGSNNCYRASDVGMSINRSFTAEAWFRMNSASWNGSASIISQNWPSANNVNLVLGGANGSGNLKVGFFNGTWYTSTTGYTPVQGRWTHVVGKYDGATLQLYIDGVRIDSTNVTAGLTGGINNNGYSIGKSWGGDYFFNGSIAAVRVYNRAISESEILQNYNTTKARFDLSNNSLIKPTN